VVDGEALAQTLAERDRRDEQRELAPLRQADDAVCIDSTGLSLEEVVARMEREVRRRLSS
jgi:cytidylate kinase